MLTLEEIFNLRRDTRHFTAESVPDEVIQKALLAGHTAPSVGLTDATKYFLVHSDVVKQSIKNLFEEYNEKAFNQIPGETQKIAYSSLKLEGIIEAPVGLIVCYDRSVLNTFTIGTVASNETLKFSSVCAVQNIWLSLTEQGYSMGWVSIFNYYEFKKILNFPEEIEPLGYFCIGKPATNYNNQPMLQKEGWKRKSEYPEVKEIKKLAPQIQKKQSKENLQIPEDESFDDELKEIIDNKTKPLGALGKLEEVAFQVAKIFNTKTPVIYKPHILVFAADHGIAQHGVSAYPSEVTRQMINNFIDGGAAINVFCRQNSIDLIVIDSGVNYDFPTNAPIINKKIGRGTASFLFGPAMTKTQVNECFACGADIVQNVFSKGSNTIGFGEMGIGNTSTASILMSLITGITLNECIGKGTGVSDERFFLKQKILSQALENYKGDRELTTILSHFGGFEILQMAGGMLEAYKNNMLILVDGFISTVAFLIAWKIHSGIKRNALFCHCSEEKGHRLLLNHLKAEELLQLKMRLGEGSGCAVAFPVIKSALSFLNEMASFKSTGLSDKVLQASK